MQSRRQLSGFVALAVALAVGLAVSNASDPNIAASNDNTTQRPRANTISTATVDAAPRSEEQRLASEFFSDDDRGTTIESTAIRQLLNLMTERVSDTSEHGAGLGDDASFQPFSSPAVSLNIEQADGQTDVFSGMQAGIPDSEVGQFPCFVDIPREAANQLASTSALDSL